MTRRCRPPRSTARRVLIPESRRSRELTALVSTYGLAQPITGDLQLEDTGGRALAVSFVASIRPPTSEALRQQEIAHDLEASDATCWFLVREAADRSTDALVAGGRAL